MGNARNDQSIYPKHTSAAMGDDLNLVDGARWSEGVNEFVTAKSHAALAIGDVVQLAASATGVLTAAPATTAFATETGVVCEAAAAAGTFVKVQTRGFAEAYVEGTTDVAAGDTLEVLDGENEFKKDGTAISTVTAAVAVDAQAADSNVLSTVYLIGRVHTIAAS